MPEVKFEEALKKLEAIVTDLESGDLNLDDAIKKYEEGMGLSSFCYKKLQEIQKKVESLVKDSSGKVSTRNFVTEAEVERDLSTQNEGASKSSIRKKRSKAEELLF